jgi:hypothetical protein
MRRFAVALALVAACGGDEDSGPLEADDLPEALVSAYCNLYVQCGLIDDAATCRSLDLDLEFDADLLAAVHNGTVLYDESKARACLNSLFGGSCERNRVFDENSPECDTVFSGTIPDGGACAIDEQCISDSCNTPTCPDACCPGTCVGNDPPPPPPRVGESCALNNDCIDSYCDETTTTCVALKSAGTACQSSRECAEGSCPTASMVCTTLPGPGEACTGSSSSACRDIGYYCHPTNLVCTAYGLGGDTCSPQTEPCSPIYTCDPATTTCKLRPRLGEPCSTSTSATNCIDQSWCDPTTSICTAPKPDGATCDTNRECVGDCDFSTNTCKTDPTCI